MRQRKVKHEAERLAALDDYMVKDGRKRKGCWREVFADRREEPLAVADASLPREAEGPDTSCPLYLEIGCGRGHFLAAHGKQNPVALYIGAEGRSSVVLRALERIRDESLTNVLFIPEFIQDVGEYFEEGELCGIYLNFSDPWPKARHAKRRLTHRRYLEGYRRVLAKGGFLEIKTDNDALFAFTLEECEAAGLTIQVQTFDLHQSELPARLITTQYENRFRLLNEKIHYCRIQVE